MDRNTVVGLVLIGLILSVFAIFNKPTEEEIQAKQDKLRSEQVDKATNEQKTDSDASKSNVVSIEKADTSLKATDKATEVKKPDSQPVVGEIITLETDKLIVDFNTKGGQVSRVMLKGYESYGDYAKSDGEVTPLALFKDGDATNELIMPYNGKEIRTSQKLFTVKSKSDRAITFEWIHPEGGKITYTYQLKPGKFDLDYDIAIQGFDGKVVPENVMLNWKMAYRKTERLFSEQRRVSTVCYAYEKEGFSYLSEMADDYIEAEDDIDWVSYKQSYFSSFLKPDKPFSKAGSSFKVKNYVAGDDKEFTNLKDYRSMLNLNLNNTANESVRLNWYFGPNDYVTLKSYDSGYDNILNYGWGLFRWINLYAVQPLFNFLQSTGMTIGIAILMLTIVLKLLLMPIQWKMYTSSAKMRILKPEIDELNKKFPNKEDALKKQSEMMSLYRESGASPFAGCVPMLIQMPILLAVFRFFPSTFDLRQKSFLWAEDLSSYDSIYNFGFDIWLYGDHISLFTLLMAGTTLAYTVMNSGNMQQPQQPGMPNMKVIMYLFPIMMIFFFNNYSSGLSYYYFISTLISILIMLIIKKFFVDEEKLKAKMQARKAMKSAQPKKKSKFQEKLEQMQKAQMEQMKNRKK